MKAMWKTRTSQASSSEKLMHLKQELATTVELINGVLKCEQLKHEASQQAKGGRNAKTLRTSSTSFLRYSMQRRTKSCFMIRRQSRKSNQSKCKFGSVSCECVSLDMDFVVASGESSSRCVTIMVILCLR